MSDTERRAHARYPSDLGVRLSWLNYAGEPVQRGGTFGDVSLGGVFVRLLDPPSTDTQIEVTFTPRSSDREVTCRGVVMWSREDRMKPEATGIGVQLDALDEEILEGIKLEGAAALP